MWSTTTAMRLFGGSALPDLRRLLGPVPERALNECENCETRWSFLTPQHASRYRLDKGAFIHKPRQPHEPATSHGYLRRLLSHATLLGLVPPPGAFRPFGISAMVIAKNEAEWVEASIRSVLGNVDEVVVSDHGSEDGTGEIVHSLARAFPEKIRVIHLTGDEPFHEALNTMIAGCRFRWLFRFSADFIARTSGPHSVKKLVEITRGLDRRRYFCIRLSGIALQGDLEHQFDQR